MGKKNEKHTPQEHVPHVLKQHKQKSRRKSKQVPACERTVLENYFPCATKSECLFRRDFGVFAFLEGNVGVRQGNQQKITNKN